MSPSEEPTHYSRFNPQPIEVIESWGLSFHLGNVLKYIARARFKGNVKDLRKAMWYLKREIDITESEIPPRPDPQI